MGSGKRLFPGSDELHEQQSSLSLKIDDSKSIPYHWPLLVQNLDRFIATSLS